MRKFHKDGSTPKNGEIFVFGSNLAGRHGKGAALLAVKMYGAVYGKGEGLYGQSYALPTKDARIQTMPLAKIATHIENFLMVARSLPDLTFFVTSVGCGLAGYKPEQIAPFFNHAPLNCSFPDTWGAYLDHSKEMVQTEDGFSP